jgi:hypothetical protein
MHSSLAALHASPDPAWTAGGKFLPSCRLLAADAKLCVRFWAKVSRKDQEGGCWLWQAQKREDGYGKFHLRNEHGQKINVAAHRLSFALANGRWPSSSKMIMHTCDNPACVNPAHLQEGTRSENLSDCWKKNRRDRPRETRYGVGFWHSGNPGRALHGSSPLTEWDVHEIRRMASAGELSSDAAKKAAAAEFKISVNSLKDCIARRTFQWIGGGH